MNTSYVLTIAIPTFNMERWLEKNLATYCDCRLNGRLEVLCLNNASEDQSKDIILQYVQRYPETFHLVDRDSRGYGSSINAAMEMAQGKYFRIVDADDWVDTDALVKLVQQLENCEVDIVLSDYSIVNMQSGKMTAICAKDRGIFYNIIQTNFDGPCKTLPSIHATTYRRSLLKNSGFYMQDNMFFVDEEYVVLPYFFAKNVIYYPYNIYRYQVANPAQSTSPKNRAKYKIHREKILSRLISEYYRSMSVGASDQALTYCFLRIKNGIGDHFTTLYMYEEDRRAGRKLAKAWKAYIKNSAKDFWPYINKKVALLHILNCLHVSLKQYDWLKAKLIL